MTAPAPSETTKPRRSMEKGRLERSGGSFSLPFLAKYAPFMVWNPARIGSTRAQSTAPQMATSARSWAMSRAPTSIEVRPVAQAVMVERIGPLAPVSMAIFPPIMLMQELGLA